MKLRGLTLENVRKFAGQRAEIEGIGDGISVISEANEFGKSTFFDALHALMFTKYSATSKDVKSLRPPSGGAVRVSARIETEAGLFTLEKSFLAKQRATVRDAGGGVIAQDDEAERWAAQLMGNGAAGPAGLLWVRQGLTGLETPLKRENEQLLEVRKDLLSSVAGEIDMVTGGRRMDRVIRAARDTVGRLATPTGRALAKGPWAEAMDEAERQGALRDRLAMQVAGLRSALDRREAIARQLRDLDDPEAQAARLSALNSARAAHKSALAHADLVSAAQKDAQLARLKLDAAQADLDTLLARQAQTEAARKAQRAAEQALTEAQTRSSNAEAARVAAAAQADHARRTARVARSAHIRAGQAALREELTAKLETARLRVEKADSQRKAAEEARAALAPLKVTPSILKRIERAERGLAEARSAEGVVCLTLEYKGDARVRRPDGEPLLAGGHPVTELQQFDLVGIGRMTIDPGSKISADALDKAQARLEQALAASGMSDPDAARRAAQAYEAGQRRVELAQGSLDALAPDGLDPLRAEVTRIEDQLSRLAPAQDDATAPVAEDLAPAERAEEAANRALREAEEIAVAARVASERARAVFEEAERSLKSASAALGPVDVLPQARAKASSALARADALVTEADARVAGLTAQAPDLATVNAELARAEGAIRSVAEQTARLQEERSELNGRIRSEAEEGLEEKFAEARDRHIAAADRAARFAHEVASLRCLLDTLENTRSAAQDAYFGPVQAELQPLLAILQEDAALSFDPTTLLPAQMERAGTAEDVIQLSGGTQEQIAVLTRLAFARLFARQGTPVPVILDDALVYSDDNRIERMFTALHRVAQGQQVIVFTCRQRAFAGLGGDRPRLQITSID